MIKGVIQTGKHVAVSGGQATNPYFSNYSGQTMVGQLRYNPNTTNIEVYDGNSWLQMGTSYASVGLTMSAEEAIDWVIKKQQEERELDELCKQHPALQEAYERLQIIKALVKQSNDENKGKV
jgi:hypothetical protein